MSKPIKIEIPGPQNIFLCNVPDGGPAGVIPFLPIDANIPTLAGGLERTVNGDVSPDGPFVFKNFASNLGIFSNGAAAGTITFTGFDIGGNPLTESIAGPAASTVYTTNRFAQVTSVTIDDAYTDIQIFNGPSWRTNFIRGDYDRKYWNATVQLFCDILGTTPFKVYATGWPIPTGVYDPASIPGTVIVNGDVNPIPSNIALALQQQAFPVTAVWMETVGEAPNEISTYFNLALLQQGVRA